MRRAADGLELLAAPSSRSPHHCLFTEQYFKAELTNLLSIAQISKSADKIYLNVGV